MNRNACAFLTAVLAASISLVLVTPASAQFTLVRISTDKFTNSDSTHRTEVEPDTFSWGSDYCEFLSRCPRARIHRLG